MRWVNVVKSFNAGKGSIFGWPGDGAALIFIVGR